MLSAMDRPLIICALLFLASFCSAQNLGSFNGQCAKGGQSIMTQGLQSSGTQPLPSGTISTGTGAIGSYPSCTVTVFLTGTSNLATLYSNNAASPTPLANPFTSNTDGSVLFFAATQIGYDVNYTGGGIPSPVTLTDIVLCNTNCGVAPTGAITVETNGTLNTTQSLLNFTNANGCTWTNPSGGVEEVQCLVSQTNGTPNTTQGLLNFTSTTGASGITAINPSGGVQSFSVANIQGTDANLLSSGTVASGAGHTFCTDSNSGATTSGCSSGGGTVGGSGTVGTLPVWFLSTTTLGNSFLSETGSGVTGTVTETGATFQFNSGSGNQAAILCETNGCSQLVVSAPVQSSVQGGYVQLNPWTGSTNSASMCSGTNSTNGNCVAVSGNGTTTVVSYPESSFANLPSPLTATMVYCTNCTVATPCTGSGSGAWAFANGTQWKCPF